MSSEFRLAEALVREHPDRAAAVLERISVVDAARVVSGIRPRAAAALVQRTSPLRARDLMERVSVKRATEVLEALDVDVGARLARTLSPERQSAAIEGLPDAKAASVRTLLRFPENTAGALTDPNVLALPEDMTAREALGQVHSMPRNTHYNLYVVDRQRVLMGALNLRELFLAQPKTRLADLMVPNPFRIDARASRAMVVAHPGWKVVHSLPVVDGEGRYVGAIRYGTLRALEEALFKRTTSDDDPGEALGQLFAAGVSGLLTALTTTGGAPEGED